MWKAQIQAFRLSFSDIFNTRDDDAKGRVINLGSTLLAAFYNVFITGIFYTGFLSMYGISITGAGIVTFIPYIANIFTIFSAKVLSRFRRRKPILIGSKIFFYFMYIVATTVMPQFVTDPDARLAWLVVLIFIAHAVYAPFAPGFSIWFYNFYPKDNTRRARYLMLCEVFRSIMATIILLLSGFLTDAVAGSPMQEQLILWFRYLAFGLVVIETVMQLRAKEYPAADDASLKLREVFTLPFKYRKFILCVGVVVAWNFISCLNSGTWGYHVLNHLGYSYTLINSMSVMYTVILLFMSGWWSRQIKRLSWIRAFGISMLCYVPSELLCFPLTPDTAWLYVAAYVISNVAGIGLNLIYSNIVYTNLPEENSTAHIAFYTIITNVSAFLGMIVGTWVSSISGDNTMPFWGMQVYSVQFTLLMRAAALLIMGCVLVKHWRAFTNDATIAEVEHEAAVRLERKKNRTVQNL